MSDSVTTEQAVAATLGDAEYNRQRVSPRPSDDLYIHLSDLRLFLGQHSAESFGKVLDYGCGGSPYRELFKADTYIRADYVNCGELDYVISRDGKTSLPDDYCDCVLSSQVLEHVFSPRSYLAEALRVLRPGGKLLLTTHGIWDDHGCPHDFRRWTADGLRQDLEDVGFRVMRVSKLTTGARAVLFLFSQALRTPELKQRRISVLGLALWLLRHSSFGKVAERHRWMDRTFWNNRMVDASASDHRIYLALGIIATKPSKGQDWQA